MTTAEPVTSDFLAALHNSHERLKATLDGLDDAQAEQPAYPSEWSIGQVASHLGSGAEIFTLFVGAGIDGEAAPGMDRFQEIWGRWNAKSAQEQVRDAVPIDGGLLDRVDLLSADEAAQWRLEFFGEVRGLPSLLAMRLSEHALHTWDVVVAGDPSATLDRDAVDLLIDATPATVVRAGTPSDQPQTVQVRTVEPDREFVLTLSPEGATLEPGTGDTDSSLQLPAEAFLRLVAGRLDADHTPASVQADGVDLDVLRTSFPGY